MVMIVFVLGQEIDASNPGRLKGQILTDSISSHLDPGLELPIVPFIVFIHHPSSLIIDVHA